MHSLAVKSQCFHQGCLVVNYRGYYVSASPVTSLCNWNSNFLTCYLCSRLDILLALGYSKAYPSPKQRLDSTEGCTANDFTFTIPYSSINKQQVFTTFSSLSCLPFMTSTCSFTEAALATP